MKIILPMFIILFLFACNTVKTNNNIKRNSIKKEYSTKFCKTNKKLWADSFLGKEAPHFEVEGWVSEKPNTEGKFILIDFWGLHCPQCKKAIPELNEISKKYKDNLVVIGIATERKNSIKSMRNPTIEYYSAYDRYGKLKNKYQVRGIPHVVIIAPDNTVVWEGYPFLGDDRLTLEKVGQIINQ
jgi:thiol-disulfide isomerase/thioredoxin